MKRYQEEEENGRAGTHGSCLLFLLLKYQDKAAHSCPPSLRRGGSVWQLRMWAAGTGAEMGKKTGCFFTLGGSCATVCGVGATCRCSEVTKLKQKLAREAFPDLQATLAKKDVG